jgi:peptidoglycan/xylan/chitin deacetylase (PgdA/CDA1 family)
MKKLLLSVDLDDLWCSWPNKKYSFLASSIESMLELFDNYKIKATLFCVAKDKEILKDYIPELIKKGHEIANHSYKHKYNKELAFDEKKMDIMLSNDILSEISNSKILGYRAPGWGIDAEVSKILHNLDYKYDASLAISPLFIPMRYFHSIKFRKKTYIYGTSKENLGLIKNNYLTNISLDPVLLLPFYGSFHLYMPLGMKMFKLQTKMIQNKNTINYIMHAFDFYKTNKIDSFPLTKSNNHFEDLDRILANISYQRSSVTYIDSLD